MIQASRMTRPASGTSVDRVEVAAFTIPTDAPEADGTLEWHSTTIVVVHVHGGDQWGLGYTYGPKAAAELIREKMAEVVVGRDAMAVPGTCDAVFRSLRNAGQPGLCSMALSALDSALWDLKARLLDVPLVSLLGPVRDSVAVYGSGGFTSYDDRQLAEQLAGWVGQGIPRVKMKVGRDAEADLHRVSVARHVIGLGPELFVDANGGYSRKEALAMAGQFAERFQVTWFEEPRPSDDLTGLRLLRDQGPPGMDIAAGEYGYKLPYFRHMLEVGAVDCIQPDVTRCGGITGFMKVAAVCEAFLMPLSAHTAPALSTHVCCAARPTRHLEYFHDHVRIEQMFFDGLPRLEGGALHPDLSRPGHGLTFKQADAERYTT